MSFEWFMHCGYEILAFVDGEKMFPERLLLAKIRHEMASIPTSAFSSEACIRMPG